MSLLAILSLLALATPALSQPTFLNGFGDPVDFHCPDGYALSEIVSQQVPEPPPPMTGQRKRNTESYDRLWNFDCTPVSLFLS